MNIPFNLQRLIETELQFPKRFTNCTPKDFGMIYWNEGNKASSDSNHAVITDFVGIGSSIKEILSFYKAKGITPRLYPAFKENELDLLSPLLETNAFVIENYPNQFFLHQRESGVNPVHGIHFERLKTITPELKEFVLSHDEWPIKVLERHLSHPNFHLLGGFVNDVLVTLASVSIFAGYSRVDDVYTHEFYRGKGYSSALIHYVIQYHKEHSENFLYLYSAIPEAIKVYGKAGFSPIAQNLKFWTAYKEL